MTNLRVREMSNGINSGRTGTGLICIKDICIPENVGVRETVHQLHFVKHVLAVGRQKVHLEHHHFIGRPMCYLQEFHKLIG